MRRGAAAGAAAQQLLPEDVTIPYATPPSSGDLYRFYPARALERSQGGQVSLGCLVRPDHGLRCGVIDAAPEEFAGGFAQGAVRALQNGRVRVAAQASNGQATAGQCIRRRVSFRMG